jgi:hypothetical protein
VTAPSRTRECKGCEGSGCGCVEKTMLVFRAAGSSSEPCADCPACLGSGRVTDGPFRRDAEVDAETLRANVATFTGTSDAWWAAKAGRFAERAAWKGHRAAAFDFARDAARAAFRAVPGLRGE